MTSTWTMEDIERRYGKPFREVLVDLYEEHGRVGVVARELGVSRQALWMHMKLAGLNYRDLRLAVRERARERRDGNATASGQG